jgi:hypothetical protein
MNTPTLAETRASFSYLRSVCRSFEERLVLGEAIRNGWTARGIELEAGIFSGRGPKDLKYRLAIQNASKRQYYSPEQQAADEQLLREKQEADDAREAIKATKDTRPKIPSSDYAPIRAACKSMLDCDRLQAVLDAGWCAADIMYLARVHSEVAVHVPNKATPGAIRFALALIENWPAGQYYSWFPRPTQSN